MRPGEYKITVEGVEGRILEATVDLHAITQRAASPAVAVAMDDGLAMELVTILSIVAGAAESEVWRQQRAEELARDEQERQMASLRAAEEEKGGAL
jgi:hypothetical protein